MVVVCIAILAFMIGFWMGAGPARHRQRRLLVLRSMLDARGDVWIRGMTMIERMQGAIGRSCSYVILHGLEDDGLVESKEQWGPEAVVRGMRPSRWYRLTPKGEALIDAIEKGRSVYVKSEDGKA